MLSVTGDYQNINKTNLAAIFKESFERSMRLATIKNWFRITGIYSFNPEAIDKTRLIPVELSPSSTPLIPTSTLQGATKVASTPTNKLEKSEHDFPVTSSKKAPLFTSAQNILTKMNIVPQYLADVFYLPSSERTKRSYKSRVITQGRTITEKQHQALYKEKEEIKSRKEKE